MFASNRLLVLLATFLLVRGGRAAETFIEVDLNEAEWEISNQNGSITVGAVQLPVMALQALYEAGKLSAGDPIYRYNDRTYAWVVEETWSYQVELNVTGDVLQQQAVDLVMSGIDTVADVYIGSNLTAELSNAHREFRLPMKNQLVEGSNLLTIVFHPAPTYARSKAADVTYTIPMQPYPRGYDHYNFIRKPASDFGWDWGPAFSPSGIYGSVKMQAYSTAFLTGASVRQEHQDDGQIDVYFDAIVQASADEEGGTLTVTADNESWEGTEDVVLHEGENIVTVKVAIEDDYSLWWPTGFGAAQLYNFTLQYATNSSVKSQAGTSTLHRRIGLRTIELVEQPLRDPAGFSFYFRVNGIPTYARGANMIPLQIFHSQNSPQKYRHMVEDAVAANMNMLRIWGGGLYQMDSFYDIADELGMLIWQEAMFACAQYPRDSTFLANVASEVGYQARRLGHHASLAIWGGNNEVETAFEWFPESRSNEKLFTANYEALFVNTVRTALMAVDQNVAFVDSSPSKGVYSLNPYSKRWGNPSDVSAGDVHFYDYSSNCLDPAIYPRAKFVSEYGFQSYPSFSVYKQYTEASDWSIQSNMSDYRQRHQDGNAELQTQMQSHFEPIAANATNEYLQERLFQQWIYLTQVQQSMCYETAIANWRRLKAAPDARTMGVLYWQLNDIWAGPSWSGIDYGGHWKLLMYNIRKLYNPVAVSGTYNATQADALSVYMTNDQPWTVSGEVTVELISWGSRSFDMPIVQETVDFSLSPLECKVVTTMPIKTSLGNSSMTLQDAVVRLTASAQGNPGELTAQTCSADDRNPFATICTPAKGVQPLSGSKKPKPATSFSSPLGMAAPGSFSVAEAPASSRADESYDSSQVVWLSEPKEAAIVLDPHIKVDRFRQLDGKTATFQISSRNVAVFVYLDSDAVEGIFSDNGFLLLPWEPQSITFSSRNPISASDLRSSLTVMSLADTLSGGRSVAY